MEGYQTEEQQLAAIKHWWHRQGKSILMAVLLVCGGLFIWKLVQSNAQTTAEQASEAYQSVVAAYTAVQQAQASVDQAADATETAQDVDAKSQGPEAASTTATEAAMTTLNTLVTEMQQTHPKSSYAHLASFYLAKQAMDAGKFSEAASQFQWVTEQAQDAAILAMAQLRLARVHWAQENYSEAHAVIDMIDNPVLNAAAKELAGDLWVAQGELSKAKQAYTTAYSDADEQLNRRPFLELKLNDLAQ